MYDVTEERAKYIGGSDVPKLMNLSSFGTRWDTLLEKAGLKDLEFFQTKYTKFGDEFEPHIREYYQKIQDIEFKESRSHGFDNRVRYHSDGLGEHSDKTKHMLEIKTTNRDIQDPRSEAKDYIVQLLTGAIVENFNENDKLTILIYKRPQDFSDHVFDPARLRTFEYTFKDFMDEEVPRIISAIQLAITHIDRLKTDEFLEEVDLFGQELQTLSDEFLANKTKLDEYKDKDKDLREQIKHQMCLSGQTKIKIDNKKSMTLTEAKPASVKEEFDLKAFKEAHPRIYKKFTKEVEVPAKSEILRLNGY